jgi:radical SAM superfamily enzyme YgiQ (UPF0313 family)
MLASVQARGDFETDLLPKETQMRILLLKPYQPVAQIVISPPLGLLYLAAELRERFGDRVEVEVVDMKGNFFEPEWVKSKIDEFEPDLIGCSALNVEAGASHEIAEVVKKHDERIITVLGGPYPHHRAEEILGKSQFDWIFGGPADRTFPEAIARHMAGEPLGTDLPGFSYRTDDGIHVSNAVDTIKDLDTLPLPAWDLCDWSIYDGSPTPMAVRAKHRYAHIFTSRGCPYKCHYCHDLFGKRFYHRGVESVIAEIELLYEKYGVEEFQIIDDIFNLHKPRLKAIMEEVKRRWPGKLAFCFPNGVRADLLDEEVLDALAEGGTYAMNVAVETVTPRLQALIEKHLDVDHVAWAIDEADKRGILVGGLFMVGFPTETPEEIQATFDFAHRSRLTIAHFFQVVPQPETPLYDLAKREDAVALEDLQKDELTGGIYRGSASWYERAYGYPLKDAVKRNNYRFYFKPSRILRALMRAPWRCLPQTFFRFVSMLLAPKKVGIT